MKALIFLVSLTLLVVTHELGHLLFAKLFGTRVNRFYVFFNWKFSIIKAKKFNGKWHFLFFNSKTPESWETENLRPEDQNNTLWGLGWIPLGGYCDIAGMIDETKDSSDMASTPHQAGLAAPLYHIRRRAGQFHFCSDYLFLHFCSLGH